MRFFSFIAVFTFVFQLQAQQTATSKTPSATTVQRPKLVVGIMVDQMRWDYLYRYYDRYAANGGFKRMLNQGFSCENTFIPYTPTITACGHTSVYTGSVPAVHGITGNSWYDYEVGRMMYCSEDKLVKTVGSTSNAGEMSPRNMLTTTICDELRLATNFRSKVIGIAIKDRGGILPAGHSANAAYWYDSKNGNWITSTYYMNDLPQWVKNFNDKKYVDAFYEKGWNTVFPINTYAQSTKDENEYEAKPFGSDQKGFPYDFKKFVGKNYGAISSTPYGNTLTMMMAKEAVASEELGKDAITDFLAVSFSSSDYIGHAFGPNSIEAEDGFLRLDKDLGELFDYLDKTVGKGQYVSFLTADHGVAHVPGFSIEHKLPGGVVDDNKLVSDLNKQLSAAYGANNIILGVANYQVSLNHKLIDSAKLDRSAIVQIVMNYARAIKGVDRVFEIDELTEQPMNAVVKDRLSNGWHPKRSGDIQIILAPGWIDGGATGTTHGLWNPYDSHIPLVWYGWGIKPGKSNQEVYMTDIAPTIAAMLRIQMPSGCVGKPILPVLQ
ncbi:alkaline phosphatase family protein [Lacibacter luteus]|uniref:Alkaline phosphatase family protein n=1 Tax=Lacibacter luteus TaxID=2508719 RepID=A0A4Q1CE09_9BACT|nr:alkaline phosphatase PafA [Lacibacter luteus]RXK57602.1 alkaline phosphatase family protein [Lacibacter luteus]